MYCNNCGTKNKEGAQFCTNCGMKLGVKVNSNLIGFSDKINDPFFRKYIKNTNSYRKMFAIGLSIIITVAFFLYGQFSDEMDNPQALFIGLGIGIVYSLIASKLSAIKEEPSWEGTVIDKKKQRRRRRIKEANGYRYEDYIEYIVYFGGPSGQTHEVTIENNDLLFDYYNIGDRIKFHGLLRTIEKYDKSKDEVIFCNACSDVNDIKDDYCHRCKAPLLK